MRLITSIEPIMISHRTLLTTKSSYKTSNHKLRPKNLNQEDLKLQNNPKNLLVQPLKHKTLKKLKKTSMKKLLKRFRMRLKIKKKPRKMSNQMKLKN